MKLKTEIFITLLLITLLLSNFVAEPLLGAVNKTVITIESDGSAYVEFNSTLVEGLNSIKLPVEPIPETIRVNEEGKSIPPIFYNMTLIVPAEVSGSARISYVANVSTVGGVIYLNIFFSEVVLKVREGIVLLSIPENITTARTEDNTLVVIFNGPAKIAYTVTELAPGPSGPTIPSLPWWISLLGLGVIIVLSALFLFRRRVPKELDELDREILSVLRKSGGRMLQSELMKELDVPKTTLWRHVKRLERLGYVEIKQVGRVNIVILKK